MKIREVAYISRPQYSIVKFVHCFLTQHGLGCILGEFFHKLIWSPCFRAFFSTVARNQFFCCKLTPIGSVPRSRKLGPRKNPNSRSSQRIGHGQISTRKKGWRLQRDPWLRQELLILQLSFNYVELHFNCKAQLQAKTQL
jgi:hypothetical protein